MAAKSPAFLEECRIRRGLDNLGNHRPTIERLGGKLVPTIERLGGKLVPIERLGGKLVPIRIRIPLCLKLNLEYNGRRNKIIP